MASLILTALFAVTVLISALYGLIRGLNKSVVRIITVVPAILLTFGSSSCLSRSLCVS